MGDLRETVTRNAARIRETVDAACRRSGRSLGDVRIVAVTKGHPREALDAARAAGLTDIGENRVPEAAAKQETTGPGLVWHLIGHLQTNKARKALAIFDFLHALDRPGLVEVLATECARAGRPARCFLQVNVSGEASKGGVTPSDAEPLLRQVIAVGRIEPVGLMTMAPLSDNPESARPVFKALRELRDALRRAVPGAKDLTGLSMGMSQDYAVAVEEGATHVRIGTALFSPPPPDS
jgi:hypothetical protein